MFCPWRSAEEMPITSKSSKDKRNIIWFSEINATAINPWRMFTMSNPGNNTTWRNPMIKEERTKPPHANHVKHFDVLNI